MSRARTTVAGWRAARFFARSRWRCHRTSLSSRWRGIDSRPGGAAGRAPDHHLLCPGGPGPCAPRGLTGALAPLAPFPAKLTIIRGLDCYTDSPNNGHSQGSAAFACGFSTPVLSTKGGPSLDWVVHEASETDTLLPTLSARFLRRRQRRRVNSLQPLVARGHRPNLVILDTLTLFEAIFGGRA